jgi:hypothetical protein
VLAEADRLMPQLVLNTSLTVQRPLRRSPGLTGAQALSYYHNFAAYPADLLSLVQLSSANPVYRGRAVSVTQSAFKVRSRAPQGQSSLLTRRRRSRPVAFWTRTRT